MKSTKFYYPKVPGKTTKENKEMIITICVYDTPTEPVQYIYQLSSKYLEQYWNYGVRKI